MRDETADSFLFVLQRGTALIRIRSIAQAIMNAETAMKPARMGATTVEHKLFKGMIQRKGTADDGTPRGYPDDFGDFGLSIIRFDDMSNPSAPKPLGTLI